ncbi:hypothetical protein ABZ816_25850 [Actinosynnema sp. NPDC047251]|uniref:ANTAR domain-containing protein n=1 Tax=Saccharothrix espanaensis (strain ATCC 51144 / DSM 44229 / JCM 9112 / NBRC 15066 / NRRL 15764) TaxID=1179773 RepID=K0K0G3_SACES|nr:hypothetical protein [Saccharothrix espanaensis]CCH31831.1 hypothetical protein BN6_45510 [Saccharothrix espanaensis DSM 44229]
MSSGPSEQAREAEARRVVDRMLRRAALHEAIGILQVWNSCGPQQARDDLHHSTSQDTEAHRVIAAVDATADGRDDPDLSWE